MALLLGCGGAKAGKAMEKTLDMMSPETRENAFETMMRAMDENPALVDEMYRVTRRHPQVLHRFMANSSHDLKDPAIASANAVLLANDPEALTTVMEQSIDAAKERPEARRALIRAMKSRSVAMADIGTDDPEAVRISMNATLKAVQNKPRSRAALLRSMQESSERVADVLIDDPKTVGVLVGALVKQGADVDFLKARLKDAFH